MLAAILPAEYAVASPTPVNQVAHSDDVSTNVDVQYRPTETLRVTKQREIRVRTAVGGSARLQVERLRGEAD